MNKDKNFIFACIAISLLSILVIIKSIYTGDLQYAASWAAIALISIGIANNMVSFEKLNSRIDENVKKE